MTDNTTTTLETTAVLEDLEAHLSRIASALERIADRLDWLDQDGPIDAEPQSSGFATMSPT